MRKKLCLLALGFIIGLVVAIIAMLIFLLLGYMKFSIHKDWDQQASSFYLENQVLKEHIRKSASEFEAQRNTDVQKDENFSVFKIIQLKTTKAQTCFFEAAIQMLLASKKHCDYLLSQTYDSNNQKISLATQNLLKNVQDNNSNVDITEAYLTMMSAFSEAFSSNEIDGQCDAAEFYHFLMHKLAKEESYNKNSDFVFNKNSWTSDSSNKRIEPLTFDLNLPASDAIESISEILAREPDISKNFYPKYVLLNISRAVQLAGRVMNKRYFLISDHIQIGNINLRPKLILCYNGNVNTGNRSAHYYTFLFTPDSCFLIDSRTFQKVSTETAYTKAFEEAVSVLYERMD